MAEAGAPEHGSSTSAKKDSAAPVLCAGDFQVNRLRRRLKQGDRRIRIQQKPLAVLIYLMDNHERLVTREELLREFWPRAVNEESLTRCISTIRQALQDTADPPRYIETLWGQGYRFIEEVATVASDTTVPADHATPDTVRTRQADAVNQKLLLLIAALVIVTAVWLAPLFEPAETPPAPASAIQRIAVLPITAPDHEGWIADALTGHLVRTIARIEGVTVVASGSTARLAGQEDPRDLGQQLGVDAVLSSDLQKSGQLAEMHSQLVSTSDGSIVWNYAQETDQLGPDEVQVRQLAQAMARQLWANLQLRNTEREVDSAAYRHYLRGRYHWNQRSAPSLRAAVESFNSALAIDPDYVDALIGLADTWLVMPLYGAVEPNEAIPRARAMAERALEIDPGEAHAHAVIGVINMQFDWDWLQAESHLLQAVKLNPSDVTAVQWLGELYCYQQRMEECWRHLKVAAGLDPLSPVMRMLQGSPYLWSGEFETAIQSYQAAMIEAPDFTFTAYAMGLAHAGLGDWAGAIDLYQDCLPEVGLAILGGPMVFAFAKNGETESAEDLLSELEALARERFVPPTKLATAYLGLGDVDSALFWLQEALLAHDDRLVYLAVDHHFRELHGDPRFEQIADTVGVLDTINAELADQV